MKLLLDSANIDEIRRFSQTEAVAGVTTNPALVSKEQKRDYIDFLTEIATIVNNSVVTTGGRTYSKKHLSVEVTTLDPDEMIKQAVALNTAIRLNKMNLELFIKIPVMPETLRVISVLRYDKQLMVNATACMTATQAKIASEAGAHIVSFFYNRMLDGGEGGNEITRFVSMNTERSKVICGSIRKPLDLSTCWALGADYVTASAKIIDEALMHPQTTKAVDEFQEKIDKWLA